MRVLRANFARPARWPVICLWVLAAALFASVGWAGTRDWQDWATLSAAKATTAELAARIESARAAHAMQAASAAAAPPFAVDARRWMALSGLDAAGVLRSIESAQVAGAKVVDLGIDGDSRRVELEVEVANADIASTYLQALNEGLDQPVWVLYRIQVQGAAELAVIRGQLQ